MRLFVLKFFLLLSLFFILPKSILAQSRLDFVCTFGGETVSENNKGDISIELIQEDTIIDRINYSMVKLLFTAPLLFENFAGYKFRQPSFFFIRFDGICLWILNGNYDYYRKNFISPFHTKWSALEKKFVCFNENKISRKITGPWPFPNGNGIPFEKKLPNGQFEFVINFVPVSERGLYISEIVFNLKKEVKRIQFTSYDRNTQRKECVCSMR